MHWKPTGHVLATVTVGLGTGRRAEQHRQASNREHRRNAALTSKIPYAVYGTWNWSISSSSGASFSSFSTYNLEFGLWHIFITDRSCKGCRRRYCALLSLFSFIAFLTSIGLSDSRMQLHISAYVFLLDCEFFSLAFGRFVRPFVTTVLLDG